MKRKNGLVAMVAVVFLIGLSASARADWLNDSFSLPGFSGGYSTNTNPDGRVDFNAYLNNNQRITGATVNVSHDLDSNLGWVSVNFSGDSLAASAKDYQSQSLSIDRQGVSLSENVGVGAQQEWLGWDDKTQMPILGEWQSTGNGSVSLNNVTPLYAYSNYYEYDANGGGGGSGKGFADASDTMNWNESFQWRVSFLGEGKGFDSGVSVGSSSGVPEPASLGLLGVGAAALLIRRRHQQ